MYRNLRTLSGLLFIGTWISIVGICLKKTDVELELLTDVDMLLMVQKGIKGGMCHAIHHYAKANKKYMKDYDLNKESSNLIYWNVNKLYEWGMSQNFPVDDFKWRTEKFTFDEELTKSYDESIDKRYILEVDIKDSKELQDLHNDLPFLKVRILIKKFKKLVCNL